MRLHENQFIKSIKNLFAATLSLYIVTSTLLNYTTQFENRGIDIFCVPVQNNPEKFNSSQILLKTNQRTHLKAMSEWPQHLYYIKFTQCMFDSTSETTCTLCCAVCMTTSFLFAL